MDLVTDSSWQRVLLPVQHWRATAVLGLGGGPLCGVPWTLGPDFPQRAVLEECRMMNEVDTACLSGNLAYVRGSHPWCPVKEEKEEAGPALLTLARLCTLKIESSFSESLNVFSETLSCSVFVCIGVLRMAVLLHSLLYENKLSFTIFT